MSLACVAALAALLATDGGAATYTAAPDEDARVAMADAASLADFLRQALPPPPAVVVRETQTYGKITIDHAKHLSLRAACTRCHEPGRVTKIAFTPKIAHTRCIGCHKEREAGPTRCAGCHVRPPPPTTLATAPAEGEQPEGGDEGGAPAKDEEKSIVAAGPATGGAPLAGVGTVAARPSMKKPLRHVFQLGLAAGTGLGPSLRISSTRGSGLLTAYGIDRLSGGSSARMLTSLDVGVTRPLVDGWTAFTAGIVGFDAQDRPEVAFAPALGARVGLEWIPPRRRALRSVHLSVGAVTGVGAGAYGRQEGGPRVFVTLASGFGNRE
jgi:hypothetical protein